MTEQQASLLSFSLDSLVERDRLLTMLVTERGGSLSTIGTIIVHYDGIWFSGTTQELTLWAERDGRAWPCATLPLSGGYSVRINHDGTIDNSAQAEPVDIDPAERDAWVLDLLTEVVTNQARRGIA